MCMKCEFRITSTNYINDEGWLTTKYDGKLWEQIMGHMLMQINKYKPQKCIGMYWTEAPINKQNE